MTSREARIEPIERASLGEYLRKKSFRVSTLRASDFCSLRVLATHRIAVNEKSPQDEDVSAEFAQKSANGRSRRNALGARVNQFESVRRI